MVTDNMIGKASVGKNLIARGALILDRWHMLLLHVAPYVPFVFGTLAAKQAYKTQVALAHLFGHQDPQLILGEIYKTEYPYLAELFFGFHLHCIYKQNDNFALSSRLHFWRLSSQP